jgi:hypothetical protein
MEGAEVFVSSTRIWTLPILLAACGSVTGKSTDAGGGPADAAEGQPDAAGGSPDAAGGAPDASVDAPGSQPRCDPTKPFGTPILVPNVNSSLDELSFSLTQDEKTAFVGRSTGTTTATQTILSSHRNSIDGDFDTPNANLTAAINASGIVSEVSAGTDGLTLYFSRQTGNQFGLHVATRPDANASFDAGTLLVIDGVNATELFSPALSADGQTLYFGDISFSQVFSASRGGSVATFINRKLISSAQAPVVVSSDELTMYSALGGHDVLEATRVNKTATFGGNGAAGDIINVNTASSETPVAITRDGCVLYISSNRAGSVGYDIWEAHRPR